jgi:hypothetical protein
VYVLVLKCPRELPRLDLREHRLEAAHELHRLLRGDDTALAEHRGVRDGASHIVRRESDVEGDGRVEALEGVSR